MIVYWTNVRAKFGSMTAVEAFDHALTEPERRLMAGLTTPNEIQLFLDDLTYSSDNFYRCPLRVLRERTAHCFDGAVFAAAALSCLGYPPLILDMLPNDRDDEHLLALFKQQGHWGAVAKSKFAGLRFREPVYRTLRELVMSYFEQYFNVDYEKTLRSYTRPLNLTQFDQYIWMTEDKPLDRIGDRLDQLRTRPLLTESMIAELAPVDERTYQTSLLGANKDGLYRPSHK